jgi:hypothetical protein
MELRPVLQMEKESSCPRAR